jgi:hypothetical protein
MYTYDAKVWDLSIVQGPFSVAPCQILAFRFATFASLYALCPALRASQHRIIPPPLPRNARRAEEGGLVIYFPQALEKGWRAREQRVRDKATRAERELLRLQKQRARRSSIESRRSSNGGDKVCTRLALLSRLTKEGGG